MTPAPIPRRGSLAAAAPVRRRGSLALAAPVRRRGSLTTATPIRRSGSLTTASPVRRSGSPRQELLPRRGSRDRTPPWRRALARRARRSRSLGRPESMTRTGHGGAIALDGRRAGPHDGSRPVDARLDARLDARRSGRARHKRGRWLAGLLSSVPAPGRRAAARRELEAAVPEVVDVLRATVAAGINPRRALQAAAEGSPPVLEPVLRQAIQAAELGSGAGQALAAAAGVERLTELALAGGALDLAESTGAPPGPVLAGVAMAAADRVRTRQARMAATAQARLSAHVVAAMAPAFLGVLALTAPGDAAFLVREPLGWATLAAALTFELLGVVWAAHIVRGPVP
jgi:hypothetical protein